MQKFLVTEEIKQLAGGEVTLTVHIDEEEYRNAMCDFIRSGTEGYMDLKSFTIIISHVR